MALTNTSLAAAFSADALTLTATSATGATVGGFAKVDGEYMIITAINGTQIDVGQRGTLGTAVVAHNILAPLAFGLLSDLPDLAPTELVLPTIEETDIVAIGADGAIAAPDRDALYIIMKGSALASSTFANPSIAQNGVKATFTAGSAFAHVVTFTNLNDGTTGNHTTATMAAFKGATLTVVAVNGEWNTLANNLVTIT